MLTYCTFGPLIRAAFLLLLREGRKCLPECAISDWANRQCVYFHLFPLCSSFSPSFVACNLTPTPSLHPSSFFFSSSPSCNLSSFLRLQVVPFLTPVKQRQRQSHNSSHWATWNTRRKQRKTKKETFFSVKFALFHSCNLRLVLPLCQIRFLPSVSHLSCAPWPSDTCVCCPVWILRARWDGLNCDFSLEWLITRRVVCCSFASQSLGFTSFHSLNFATLTSWPVPQK